MKKFFKTVKIIAIIIVAIIIFYILNKLLTPKYMTD